MRSVSMYDPRIRDGMRCPRCGRIDWHSDGIAVVEHSASDLRVEGLDVCTWQQVATWTCGTCGQVADEGERASRLLARAIVASRYGSSPGT